MTTPVEKKNVAPLSQVARLTASESVSRLNDGRREDTDQVARDQTFVPNRRPQAAGSAILGSIQPPATSRAAAGQALPPPKSRDAPRLVLTIKDSDTAEPIEVQKGQSLVLELIHNPTTGFKWELDPTIVAPQVTLVSKTQPPDDGYRTIFGAIKITEHFTWTAEQLAAGAKNFVITARRVRRGQSSTIIHFKIKIIGGGFRSAASGCAIQ